MMALGVREMVGQIGVRERWGPMGGGVNMRGEMGRLMERVAAAGGDRADVFVRWMKNNHLVGYMGMGGRR
jgi:hypothetical protein